MKNSKNNFYDHKKLWLETVPLIFVIVSFVIALYVYPLLPQNIPSHWDASGQINGYSSRAGIFIIPGILLVLTALLFILPMMEVFRENMLKIYDYYYAFKILFEIFFTVLFISTLLPNFGYNINVSSVVLILVGLLFTGIGVLLPKLKRNFIFGIRTGWTLSSDYVWDRTHKVGGLLFTIMGLLIIILSFILPIETLFWVFIGMIVIISVWLMFYSYYVYNASGSKRKGKNL